MSEKAGFNEVRAINGKFGRVRINDELIAEATGLTAKIALNYADVPMCGSLIKHQKVSGIEGTGSLEMTKIFSRVAILLSDTIKAGKTPVFEIESTLDDPDSFGAERVRIYGCKFSDFNLADWKESTNVISEIVNFTFTDWDFIDLIEVE